MSACLVRLAENGQAAIGPIPASIAFTIETTGPSKTNEEIGRFF